jgi:putative CocE/NonD family hydrolase
MASQSLIVERNVEMHTRDGVTLRADVYRPQTSHRLPVLLQRTPYGKAFSNPALALMAAERGYAVVIQDTRGRWASEGDYYPFIHEKLDGYDAVEWVAAQDWSDGKVGMFGGSYVGYTQMAAASTHPPSLTTIIPAVTFCNPYEVFYQGGAYALGVSVSWVLMTEALVQAMALPQGEERSRAVNQVIDAVDGMTHGETLEHLPLVEMPVIGQERRPSFMCDTLAHPTPDAYWERSACSVDALTVPIFHIGGWYDIFIDSTLRNFAGIRRAGNQSQRVLIGPWVHGPLDCLAGDVDFGLRASSSVLLPDELQLRWFDRLLKGDDNGVMDDPPIQIFVMGENRWRYENDWPLPGTEYRPYYLHSQGAANSLAGDGALSAQPPVDEPVDSFLYDPRNPVPTRGGGLCCWRSALNPGAFDQREIEGRPDVLIYSTPILEEPIEVTGSIELHLWAATTAPDTDFTAKLVDVDPCGYARNIQDGIVRARYRRSPAQPEPIRPNVVYEYTIQLGPTSNVFLPGHRIRLEVSSSNFPRFHRNPNTGAPIGSDTQLRTALQTILHDADHLSHLVLPIVSRG